MKVPKELEFSEADLYADSFELDDDPGHAIISLNDAVQRVNMVLTKKLAKCPVVSFRQFSELIAVLQWNKREEIEKLRTELNQIAIGRTGAQIVFNKNPEGSSPIVIVSKWRADVMGGPAIQEQTTMIKPGEGIDLSLVGLESEEVTKLRTENEKLRAEMEKARIAFVRASGRLFDINLPGEVVRDVEKILDEALRSIDESGVLG